jgi:broad specificity phosphatase PhoE
MKIFIMRHGETNYNLKRLLNEIPTKDVFLTENGINQAKEAHEKLKNIDFDKVYVSPLYRTQQTAEIVVPNKKQIIDDRLKDVISGCEGKTVDYYHKLINNDRTKRVNGGESFQDVKKRVNEFLDELKTQNLDEVLIVSHFDTIRAMMVYFKNLSDEEAFNLRIHNCEIIEVSI